MRKAATPTDIIEIKRMGAEGKTAEEISRTLRLDAQCIQTFLNLYYASKQKGKSKKKEKKD